MAQLSLSLENALETCIIAIQEDGKTVEDCLNRYPDQREQLEPLLRLAVRLQAAHTLPAPAEFQNGAAVRMRNLIASRPRAAQVQEPLKIRGRSFAGLFDSRRRTLVTAAVSILLALLLLFSGSSFYVSAQALPGDLLYPVKKANENFKLAVTLHPAADARLRLNFATSRLDEASILVTTNRPDYIDQTLMNYTSQIESETSILSEGSALSPEDQIDLANLVITRLTENEERLNLLLSQAPDSNRPSIERALAISQRALERAMEILSRRGGNFTSPLTRTPPPTVIPPTEVLPATPTPTPQSERFTPPVPTEMPTFPALPTFPNWPTPRVPKPTPILPTPRIWPTFSLPPGWPTPQATPPRSILPTPGRPRSSVTPPTDTLPTPYPRPTNTGSGSGQGWPTAWPEPTRPSRRR